MPREKMTDPIKLTGRQIGIVLSSLRVIQLQRFDLSSMPHLEGQKRPTLKEIDDLCEHINMGAGQKNQWRKPMQFQHTGARS